MLLGRPVGDSMRAACLAIAAAAIIAFAQFSSMISSDDFNTRQSVLNESHVQAMTTTGTADVPIWRVMTIGCMMAS